MIILNIVNREQGKRSLNLKPGNVTCKVFDLRKIP